MNPASGAGSTSKRDKHTIIDSSSLALSGLTVVSLAGGGLYLSCSPGALEDDKVQSTTSMLSSVRPLS